MFTVQPGGDVVYSSVLIAELDQNGTELKKIEIKDIAINDAIKTTDVVHENKSVTARLSGSVFSW